MYTCLTCEIAFAEPAMQVAHFQTEWHRYNLKRKVAELPPVSAEIFQERFPVQESKVDTKQTSYCEHCKKKFSNKKSFDNHSNSKKHLENVSLNKGTGTSVKSEKHNQDLEDEEDDDDDDDTEVEEVDSDEWEDTEEPIPVTSCLFCSHTEDNLEKNMKHMTLVHSFYIPDIQFCVNLERLVEYLGEKVGCKLQCLWCNRRSKRFWTIDATKCHMRDKGHCMMKFEGETLLEYSDYFDYSSSYPDAENPNVRPDDPYEIERLCSDGYELTLPSGAVIGHRSLLRYYKQKLNPERGLIVKSHGDSIHSKVMKHYRSLGWKGASKAEIVRKARDVQFMRHVQSRHYMKLGVKGNKLLQPHFRPQVMF